MASHQKSVASQFLICCIIMQIVTQQFVFLLVVGVLVVVVLHVQVSFTKCVTCVTFAELESQPITATHP